MTGAAPTQLRAAHVRRAHGIRGALRVQPLGGSAERFTPGLVLIAESTGTRYTVRAARGTPEGDVLLELEGMDSRNAAEVLHAEYLCVSAADARRLDDDEWFVHDLVGLRTVTPDGEELGSVIAVEPYAAQDVLVFGHDDVVRRVPMVREFVRSVDIAAGVVVLTPWPEDD